MQIPRDEHESSLDGLGESELVDSRKLGECRDPRRFHVLFIRPRRIRRVRAPGDFDEALVGIVEADVEAEDDVLRIGESVDGGHCV